MLTWGCECPQLWSWAPPNPQSSLYWGGGKLGGGETCEHTNLWFVLSWSRTATYWHTHCMWEGGLGMHLNPLKAFVPNSVLLLHHKVLFVKMEEGREIGMGGKDLWLLIPFPTLTWLSSQQHWAPFTFHTWEREETTNSTKKIKKENEFRILP